MINRRSRTAKQQLRKGQLLAAGCRCQFCGQAQLGKGRGGQYRPYNFHHADSAAYKRERLGWNLILLCVPCHALVHRLGGEPLTAGAVSRQKQKGAFPNTRQRAFTWICRLGGVRSLAALCLLLFVSLIIWML